MFIVIVLAMMSFVGFFFHLWSYKARTLFELGVFCANTTPPTLIITLNHVIFFQIIIGVGVLVSVSGVRAS
jgi:hypothetical protein